MDGFEDLDGNGYQGTGGDGINPAWNEVYNFIPDEHKEAAKETFGKWDSNFQKEIEKVQSKYEPYSFLTEKGVSGDDVRMALNIVEAIQNNPEDFYRNFGNSFGFANKEAETPAQDQGLFDSAQSQNGAIPPEVSKELSELRKGFDTVSQILLQKQQAEDEARKDQELQTELNSLRKEHGDFDEGFVLTQMMNGADGKAAVEAYQQLVERIRTEDNRPKAPRLLGSGNGGIPGNNRPDVSKMPSSDVNKLVADYLRQAQAANTQN